MNNKILTIVLIGMFFIGAILISTKNDKDKPFGGIVYVIDEISHSTVSVNQYVPALALATSTSRIDATFCNVDPDDDIYLNFISSTSTIDVTEGYQLENGECGRITDILGYLYIGSVYALASSTTSTLSVISK